VPFFSNLSVEIHNFHTVRTVVMPNQAHPPLVIDSDTVLSLAVSPQRFQKVAWWNAQTVQFGGRMQLRQLAPCRAAELFASKAVGGCIAAIDFDFQVTRP
jgi:hypothetical protein